MSKGVLIHAFGNEVVDYYELAKISALLIKKNLKLPVACVTDKDMDGFDYIIKAESQTKQSKGLKVDDDIVKYPFRNDTRFLSYDLTPFDQTLILDTDYLIFTPSFSSYFNLDVDFICPWEIKNVITNKVESYLINGTIKQAWATAIYFRKSQFAKNVFDYCRMIQDNYRYYSKLLGVRGYIRNDHILSLALHVLNGYQEPREKMRPINWVSNSIKIELFSSIDKIKSPGENLLLNYKEKINKFYKADIHVMNKMNILEPQIKNELIKYGTTEFYK